MEREREREQNRLCAERAMCKEAVCGEKGIVGPWEHFCTGSLDSLLFLLCFASESDQSSVHKAEGWQ